MIGHQLAFRGGTALHKLFLPEPERYSEDIDLVQVEPGAIGPLLSAIHGRLDPWLGKPQWKHGAGRATLYYRFMTEIEPVTPMRLKVEINTREHFTVLGLVRRPFIVDNGWFRGSAEITTYELDELLATKLRALYQRKKGRDLFDLWSASRRSPIQGVCWSVSGAISSTTACASLGQNSRPTSRKNFSIHNLAGISNR